MDLTSERSRSYFRRAHANACKRVLSWAVSALAVCGSGSAGMSQQPITTIYVGRHFEIRAHDQPTKYIFNGPTRVATVTGSLSTQMRLQRLRLWPGWNLLSLAVTATDLLGQFEQYHTSAVQSVYQWNPSTDDYFVVTAGQTVPAGSVLWIGALTNATLGVVGSYTEPARAHVLAGGGYVAGAGLEAWVPVVPPGASAWSYDSDSKSWRVEAGGTLSFLSDLSWALAPGQAMYIQTTAPADLDLPDSAARIHYYHEDHIGSSNAFTDEAGNLVEEIAYYPFGTPRNRSGSRQIAEPYGFTQKERDAESGLDYFEARFRSGALSRFISVDLRYSNPDALSTNDLSALVSHPQLLGAYAYTANNPVRWIDPTGLDPGDSFKTKDEAAIDVLKEANFESIIMNTEFGGWIYEKSGQFFATKPMIGEEGGTAWNGGFNRVPRGANIVGVYHTHADYSLGKEIDDPDNPGQKKQIRTSRTSDPQHHDFGADQFSPPDLLIAQQNQGRIPGWTSDLGTPSGEFKKFEGRHMTPIGHSDRPFGFLPADKARDILNTVRALIINGSD